MHGLDRHLRAPCVQGVTLQALTTMLQLQGSVAATAADLAQRINLNANVVASGLGIGLGMGQDTSNYTVYLNCLLSRADDQNFHFQVGVADGVGGGT